MKTKSILLMVFLMVVLMICQVSALLKEVSMNDAITTKSVIIKIPLYDERIIKNKNVDFVKRSQDLKNYQEDIKEYRILIKDYNDLKIKDENKKPIKPILPNLTFTEKINIKKIPRYETKIKYYIDILTLSLKTKEVRVQSYDIKNEVRTVLKHGYFLDEETGKFYKEDDIK